MLSGSAYRNIILCTYLLYHTRLFSNDYIYRFYFLAEKELVEFLAEEIVAEKKAQKLKMIPTMLEGFSVSLNGAEVNLEKKDGTDT